MAISEEERERELGPIVQALELKVDEQDDILLRMEVKVTKFEGLLKAIQSRSVAVLEGKDTLEAEAVAVIDGYLAPIDERLEEARELLSALSFVIDPGALQLEVTEKISALVDSTGDLGQQVEEVIDDIGGAFIDTLNEVETKRDELVEQAKTSLEEAEEAATNLAERLSEAIPDVISPVAQLIDEDFGNRLQSMTDQADALLSSVEGLIENASGALESSLGGVMDLLEQINQIVQPLDPAFDAIEILNG